LQLKINLHVDAELQQRREITKKNSERVSAEIAIVATLRRSCGGLGHRFDSSRINARPRYLRRPRPISCIRARAAEAGCNKPKQRELIVT
jgi:hypothetical protein